MATVMTPDDVQDSLNDNRVLYVRTEKGLGTIHTSKEHDARVKQCAREHYHLLDQFVSGYEALYNNTHQGRQKKVHPKYVDIKLSRFLSSYFEVQLPESGNHGVLDLNRVGKKAFAIYIRENELKNKQYFSLDDTLKDLFLSPSIEDSSKTYLDLTQDRIDERQKDRETAHASCANIIKHKDQIFMNTSALNIIISKLGLDYSPSDADKFVPQIESFITLLEGRYNALVEDEKEKK